ncbi:hypothetical protein Xph01_06020 [Micromonospora phaseoli]|nr:hypothetical protein Xph01_06020 [Micromonospora phaseoli]
MSITTRPQPPAADPTNLRRAADILTSAPARPRAAATTNSDASSVWDNEGGSTAPSGADPHRARRAASR